MNLSRFRVKKRFVPLNLLGLFFKRGLQIYLFAKIQELLLKREQKAPNFASNNARNQHAKTARSKAA